MDLRATLRSNGTVRRFTSEPVDRATVIEILDDARFAPSGGNRQPWRVAIVEDQVLRHQLADFMSPVWDEYLEHTNNETAPFNVVDYVAPEHVIAGKPNDLLDHIASVPVVLAVAVDLRQVAMMDDELDRPAMTGGGSIYPFCWNLLLSARAHGLGGVMTTFLSRAEPVAGPALGLPSDHALAATIFLGVAEHQPTKLRRNPVTDFATIDRFDGRPAS